MANEYNKKETEATYIKNGMNSSKISHDGQNVPLDEAMEMTGFGKYNTFMLVFCGSLMMGMILETLGFSYTIPASQCDLELSSSMKGWVAAIPFVGFILTSHLWGWIADTKGRKKALFLSMSVGSTFSVLSSLAPEVYSFIVLRLCAAFFIAGGAALGYAYMGEFSPLSHRDKMIALANASVALGTAVVPLIAWAVLPSDFRLPFWGMDYRPWRLLICCFASPYVVCAIIILMLPESPKFLASKGRREEALNVLAAMFTMNTGKDIREYQVSSLADEAVKDDAHQSALLSLWLQTKAMFTRQWIAPSCLVCSLQFTTFAISNGFYIWLPEVINRIWNGQTDNFSANLCDIITNLKHHNQTSSKYIHDINEACDDSLRTEAFTVTILISVAITIFTCIVAFSIQHIGKKPVLIAIFSTAACCSFALHWTTNVVASVILFCSFQLCSTAIGLVNAFVVQIYPTHMRAMAVCVAMMFGRIGSMVFSKGIGTLLEVNCPSCFFTASVLLAVTGMLTFVLPEKKSCKN